MRIEGEPTSFLVLLEGVAEITKDVGRRTEVSYLSVADFSANASSSRVLKVLCSGNNTGTSLTEHFNSLPGMTIEFILERR